MQSSGKGDVELSVTLDTSGLKKETEKIKKEIEAGVKSGNTEIKPQTDVKPIQEVTKSAAKASDEFKKLGDYVSFLSDKLKTVQDQLAAMKGTVEENSNMYSNLLAEATKLEATLQSVRSLMGEIKNAGDLQGAADAVTQAKDSTEDINAEMDRLQAILDRNREKAEQLNKELAAQADADRISYVDPESLQHSEQALEFIREFEEEVKKAQSETEDVAGKTEKQFENEYARFIEYIQAAEEKAREMAETIAGMKDVGVDPDELAKIESEYDVLINKIALMKQSIQMGSTAWNEMEVNERLSIFVYKLKEGFKELGATVGTTVLNSFKKFSTSLGEIIKKLGRFTINKLVSGFKKLNPQLNKANSGLSQGIKSILKYAIGIGSLMMLFNKLRSAMKEGINNLAQWRDGNNEVNKNLSVFISSLLQFKNQIAAAFAPIINTVVPILNTFIDSLIEAMNYLAQFIAKLTGQQTWIRATKIQKNYADSLKGTAKAAKDAAGALAPFDDLQILNQKNTSGAGSIDPNDMFEEVSLTEMDEKVNDWINKLKLSWEMADFTDFGRDIGTWLKNALDSIDWANIKATAKKIAKSIATLINGFVETEGLGDSIGRTIAEAINTAFEFVYSFVTTLHWDSVGKFIGEGILGFVNNIDGKLIGETIGQTIWGAIQLAFHTVKTFAEGGGFTTLGQQISDVINGFFTKMAQQDAETGKNGWQMLGESLTTTIDGLLTAIKTALDGLDWEMIGQAIIDLITSIDWEGLAIDLVECARSLLGGVGRAIQQMTKTDDSIIGITEAIAAALVLASSAGFSLPKFTLTVPELALVAGVVAITAANAKMVKERAQAQGYGQVNDLLNRTNAKGQNTILYGEGDKIAALAKRLRVAQEAAADGAIVTDKYIQETIDAYNDLISFYQEGADKGVEAAQIMANLLRDNSDVLYDRLADINEVMGKQHPELAEVRKDYEALNMSYESASKYLDSYNSQIGETTQEYRYWKTAEEAMNSSMTETNTVLGNTSKAMDSTADSVDGVTDTVRELSPAIGGAVTDFEVLSESVEDAGDDVSEGFMSGIINGIGQAWKNFWEDTIFWFKELFGIHSPSTLFKEFGVNIIQGLLNGIESLKDKIYELWQNIKEGVVQKVWDMRDGVIGWVQNIKRGVESQFTAIKEKSISIWNSIKDGLKTPLNAILSGVETMVNGFIKGINKMIESVNNLGSIKVPDWAKSKLGIGDFSINIPTIKEISLPRLAQGAVIPPNREFMAVLGDQSSGTNIEAPLETIKEALAEVMGNQTQSVGSAVMQLDGQTFARLVTPYVVSELGRRGYDVKVIGA